MGLELRLCLVENSSLVEKSSELISLISGFLFFLRLLVSRMMALSWSSFSTMFMTKVIG